jgi:alkanesulfonate monooxygenase SsuD/methylene tetrahydromethanopterin reductase-like flavin-dependent oxidoreductase (luciferase family)
MAIVAQTVTQRPEPGRMKIGLALPWFKLAQDGGIPTAKRLIALARHGEEVGFDSVWIPDHLLFRYETETRGTWECFSVLSAIAAVTTRIELGALVACTSFRSPALLAKVADTVDAISEGRLILGLGAGHHEPEYRAFGYPYDHLVGRFEEALAIIATLLREGTIDHEGTYYQVRECELLPRGPRPAGPPILVGALGNGKRMLRLTAQYADLWNGWLAFGTSRPTDVPPLRAAVDAACEAIGRDPATLARTVAILVEPGGRGSASPSTEGTAPISGPPEALFEQLLAFQHEGIDHIQIVLHPSSDAGIEAFAPVLELVKRG